MINRPSIVLTALPLIVAAALLLSAGFRGLAGSADASRPASVPGQIERVVIDADTSKDGIQTCRSVSVGDSVDVDIILDEVDPADGTLDDGAIANAGLRYTDAPLDLSSVAIHPDSPWSIGQIQQGSEDERGDGTKELLGYGAFVVPGNAVQFSGVQPLFRVTFDAAAPGLATVNLGNVAGFDSARDFLIGITFADGSQKVFDPFDDDEDGAVIQNLQGAIIAVGEACPQGAPQPFPDEPTERAQLAPATGDEDSDGVLAAADLCPGTAASDSIDANGCSDIQVDEDSDGVCNADAPSTGPSACELPQGGGSPADGTSQEDEPAAAPSEDDGPGTTILIAILGSIAALGVAGAAWWGLRRRGAANGGE